jgi:hypothetical protein
LGGDGCGYAVEDAVVGPRYDLDCYAALRRRFCSGFGFLAWENRGCVRRLAVGVTLSFRHGVVVWWCLCLCSDDGRKVEARNFFLQGLTWLCGTLGCIT